MFPTADQIALAIVEACRKTNCNPILTALGTATQTGARGRHLAFAALLEAFPAARPSGLARACGYRVFAGAHTNLKTLSKGGWWRSEWVHEIARQLNPDTDQTSRAQEASE